MTGSSCDHSVHSEPWRYIRIYTYNGRNQKSSLFKMKLLLIFLICVTMIIESKLQWKLWLLKFLHCICRSGSVRNSCFSRLLQRRKISGVSWRNRSEQALSATGFPRMSVEYVRYNFTFFNKKYHSREMLQRAYNEK